MEERTPQTRDEDLCQQRWELLEHISDSSEGFMVALSFVWLGLLVLDFTTGLSQTLQLIADAIWVLFGLHFALEFLIAPKKLEYLKRNWLTAVSLMLPALRVFRIFRALRLLRAARTVRSLRLLRLLTSLNRGMRALGATFGRRGAAYVFALTLVVLFAGAAGMAVFESPASLAESALQGGGLGSYTEALWWTAMVLLTLGSEYWPKTAEGRVLTIFLSLYAFAIFGYVTATLASYFIGLDTSQAQDSPQDEEAPAAEGLQTELRELRREVSTLTSLLERRAEAAAGDGRGQS